MKDLIVTECVEFAPAQLPLTAVYEHPYRLGEKMGYELVITFWHENDIGMRDHFMGEFGWTKKRFAEIVDFAWFRVEINAIKDGKELGSRHLGCCCDKRLLEFLLNDGNGYLPQLIDDAIEIAQGAT